MKRLYWFSTVAFSISSILATAAVWSAGSSQYGIISEVWKSVSVPVLLAISFSLLLLGVSSLLLGRKLCGLNNYLVPVIFLGIALVPFIFVTVLVIVKLAGIGG